MEIKYRSIVVPLDGSVAAEHALPPALTLARRHNATIHIVRVYVPVAGVYGEYAVRYDETLDRELMKRAQDYLNDVVAKLDASDVQATAALLDGPIADSISRYAKKVGADLLVMTTQGRGPISRFLLGSVSHELARAASVPVLFVRPQPEAPDLSREWRLQRVLVPVDGSPFAERVLEPAIALGGSPEVEYVLLQVVTSTSELSYGPAGGKITSVGAALEHLRALEQEEIQRAHRYLDPLTRPARAKSLKLETRVILSDRPANAILEEASAQEVDLIALTTHCRGGLMRMMLGSVTDKVLRGTESAVLIYRPVEESDSALLESEIAPEAQVTRSEPSTNKITTKAIDPRVHIGHVHLKVADLTRAIGFYHGVLGFEITQRWGTDAAFLAANGYHHHIGLNTWQSLGGSPPPRNSTGLYHLAILYPTRAALAHALRQLMQAGIQLDGSADHGVSEALYLRDPDGNGVELYWDRPEREWPRDADGNIAMTSDPLDLEKLLREDTSQFA